MTDSTATKIGLLNQIVRFGNPGVLDPLEDQGAWWRRNGFSKDPFWWYNRRAKRKRSVWGVASTCIVFDNEGGSQASKKNDMRRHLVEANAGLPKVWMIDYAKSEEARWLVIAGDLSIQAAVSSGATAVVTSGPVRDIHGIRHSKAVVLANCIGQSHGEVDVQDYGCEVTINDQKANDGDVIIVGLGGFINLGSFAELEVDKLEELLKTAKAMARRDEIVLNALIEATGLGLNYIMKAWEQYKLPKT